jgi:hypothetical protein
MAASALFLFLVAAIAHAEGPTHSQPTRIFFIGNSVTDQVDYNAFAAMSKEHSHPILFGRHMIPGSPLFYLWENQQGGFQTKPFGGSRNALANYPWDVITLQPFDRGLHGGTADKPEGDLDICQLYINTAAKMSPDAQFYIYERWPRICRKGHGFTFDKNAYKDATGQIDLSKIDNINDFSDLWARI